MSALSSVAQLLVCVAGIAGVAVAAEPAKVNVVMIVLDDQNSFALKRDIAKKLASPNLMKLAQRGVAFAHAQCAAPVCNPSRSAMFSGLRPSTSGVYDNDQGRLSPGNALERATSLPGYFHDRGYLTAGGGKLFAASFGSTVGKEVWDVTEDAATRRKGHGPRPSKESLPLNGIGKHDWGTLPEQKKGYGRLATRRLGRGVSHCVA